MPRFQSRLFNWIDQSLPARLGRNARRLIDRVLDQQLGQISDRRELPKLIAYQAARAALYPVYLLSKTTKRAFRALQQVNNWEQLPEGNQSVDRNANEKETVVPSLELLQEVDLEDQDSLENSSQTPFLLRSLSRFINWIERAKLQIDKKIDQSVTAIAKASSSNVVKHGVNNNDPNDLDTNQAKWIANQLFSQIWEQEVEKRIGKNKNITSSNPIQNLARVNKTDLDNSLEHNLSNELNNNLDQQSSNSLYQRFTLGKNNRLEELRKLIEAAIAYFFGDQSIKKINQDLDLILDPNHDQNTFVDINNPELLLSNQPTKINNQKIQEISALKETDQLFINHSLERIRQLVAAAIDYFISKRSLIGDPNIDDKNISSKANNSKINNAVTHPQVDSDNLVDSANQETENISNEFQDYLQLDRRLERLRKLIEQAIAYFFDKQRSRPTFDETNDITTTEEDCLTMEVIFGDDQGPWPLPL